MKIAARIGLVILGVGLLGACTPASRPPEVAMAIDAYYNGQFEPARATIEPLAAKTNGDFVLNNLRLGSIDLARYDLRSAESAFYKAYEVMNSVDVNKGGRDVGAVAVQEDIKVFKGEPYERAMCNFYLGLLYYMKQDYNNARAAFENALFKLVDYGEKEQKKVAVESDFVIAYIMLGKSWQKLGDEDKARDMFDHAARLRPDLRYLIDQAPDQRSNVLLVVDYGTGPYKVMAGDNSVMAIVPQPAQAGPLPIAVVHVDGRPINLRGAGAAPIDLLALAQQRRWQSMDTWRLAKSIAGTGLMAAGAYEAARSDNRSNQWAGLGMMAAGALIKASANADLRCWETVPRTTYLLPMRLSPGRHDLTVQVGGFTQTWRGVVAPPTGEATYYVRVLRYNRVMDWPPPALGASVTSAAQ